MVKMEKEKMRQKSCHWNDKGSSKDRKIQRTKNKDVYDGALIRGHKDTSLSLRK